MIFRSLRQTVLLPSVGVYANEIFQKDSYSVFDLYKGKTINNFEPVLR